MGRSEYNVLVEYKRNDEHLCENHRRKLVTKLFKKS